MNERMGGIAVEWEFRSYFEDVLVVLESIMGVVLDLIKVDLATFFK